MGGQGWMRRGVGVVRVGGSVGGARGGCEQYQVWRACSWPVTLHLTIGLLGARIDPCSSFLCPFDCDMSSSFRSVVSIPCLTTEIRFCCQDFCLDGLRVTLDTTCIPIHFILLSRFFLS